MSVAMHLDRRDVFSRATAAVRVLDQHRQDSFERARGPEGLSVRPERFPGWFNNKRHPPARPEDLYQHSAAADFLAGPENGDFPGSGLAKFSGRKLKSLKTNGASPAAAKRHSFAREVRGRMGTDSLRPSGSLALHGESFLAFPPIGTWPGEGGSSRGHRAFFSAPDRRKERELHHRDTGTQSYSLGFSRYLLEVRKESLCPCVPVVKLSRTAMQNQHRVMRVPVMTRTTPVLWGHA